MASSSVRKHNETVLSSLKKGDLVEFERSSLTASWAVYVGNGKVVHLLLDSKANIVDVNGRYIDKGTVKVKVDDFFEIAAESMAKKTNHEDKFRKPKTGDVIAKIALKLVGYEVHYDTSLWQDCADFTTFCRYGVAESDKVHQALDKKLGEDVKLIFL